MGGCTIFVESNLSDLLRMAKTKGQKKMGQKAQHFKHVSFLLQCSDFTAIPESLRHRYAYLAKKVADKAQVRLHKSYKRRFCQRCFKKYEESVVLRKNGDHFVLQCEKCFYTRNLPKTEHVKKTT